MNSYDSKPSHGTAKPRAATATSAGHADDHHTSFTQDPGRGHASASFDTQNGPVDAQHASSHSQTESVGNRRGAKKRKPNKDAEKRFICPEDGCDKRYSRAEHLYRHQLNHAPKNIFICDRPGCDRRFVRQDLCTRHKERHDSKKSGLIRTTKSRYDLAITYQYVPPGQGTLSSKEARRDSTVDTQTTEPQTSQPSQSSPNDGRHLDNSAIGSDPPASSHGPSWHEKEPPGPHITPTGNAVVDQQVSAATQYSPTERTLQSAVMINQTSGYNVSQTQHYPEPYHGQSIQHHGSPYGVNNYGINPQYAQHVPQQRRDSTSYSPTYHHQRTQYMSPPTHGLPNSQTLPSLAAFTHNHQSPVATQLHPIEQAPLSAASSLNEAMYHHPTSQTTHLAQDFAYTGTDQLTPVFNNEIYSNTAPFNSENDFTQWLFDSETTFNIAMIPPDMLGEDFYNQTLTPQEYARNLNITQRSPAETTDVHTPSGISSHATQYPALPLAFESVISLERRAALLEHVEESFHDRKHVLVTEHRKSALAGDRENPSHVLSRPMLETYISSFWNNVHSQLPILHRPTFATESCPDLLLLTILALGASNLDQSHGFETRTQSSDLAFFLAWHVRNRIYQDPDFGPPARLWIFQALLLLEIYEKMYSSRCLHERSHVHHATTITLMRRGSSLIGRHAQDFPKVHETTPASTTSATLHSAEPVTPGPNPSVNHSGYNTDDPTWNAWISSEATRRIAFAAFIIDTTHAHMFGHSAVMVAHEMRIALPCDEAMWAADSMAEVAAIRTRLASQGYRQVSFLEALKKTLNCTPVRTNTFGRVSIMAGLLSVSWHMKMQDVRVSSVGIGRAGEWGEKLSRAFDFWKEDFDESIRELNSDPAEQQQQLQTSSSLPHRDNVFEARTVLQHLAHMAMHCDVLDCMIFAGATRLLGRIVTPRDRNNARRRMQATWATSARARDSTFHALRFLRSALMPDGDRKSRTKARFTYAAREDVLLNRPWVLHLAAMTVWSYGYAREGSLRDPAAAVAALSTEEAQVRDMEAFLDRLGSANSPPWFDDKAEGKNMVLGLLMLLRRSFLGAKWELLHEAAELMGNCIRMLVPGQAWEGMNDRATGN